MVSKFLMIQIKKKAKLLKTELTDFCRNLRWGYGKGEESIDHIYEFQTVTYGLHPHIKVKAKLYY